MRRSGNSGGRVMQILSIGADDARALVEGLGRLPGVEILWRPVINQGLVRLSRLGLSRGADGAGLTALRARLRRGQTARPSALPLIIRGLVQAG